MSTKEDLTPAMKKRGDYAVIVKQINKLYVVSILDMILSASKHLTSSLPRQIDLSQTSVPIYSNNQLLNVRTHQLSLSLTLAQFK